MKKLTWFLWCVFVLSYLLVLNQQAWEFISQTWMILIGFCVILTVVCVLLLSLLRKRDRVILLYKTIPKVLFKYNRISGLLSSLFLTLLLSFFVPALLIYFLAKMEILRLGYSLGIYTCLLIWSMVITFYGKFIINYINSLLIYNPSKESIQQSEYLLSEDIVKTGCFAIYFILLIIQAVVKFKHIETGFINDETVYALVFAFTTYIALDRVVTTYRRAKLLKRNSE